MRQPHPSRFLDFVSRCTLLAFIGSSLPHSVIAQEAAPPASAPQVKKADPDSKKADTQKIEQASSTALCDEEVPGTGLRGGYGSVVYKWPEWGPNKEPSKEFQAAFKRYLEERKKVVFDANMVTHKKYVGSWGVADPVVRAPDAPNLTRSVQAVMRFHDISFGQNSAVIFLCEYKRQLTKNVSEYDAAKKQASTLTGEAVNACAGANKTMFDTYKAARDTYEKLEREIKKRLDGSPSSDGTKIPGLNRMFFWARKEHFLANNHHKKKIEALSKPDSKKLDDEFQAFWGKGSVTHGDNDKIDTNGYYSDFLLQTREELKKTEAKKKWFEDNKTEFQKLEQRCDSLDAPAISHHGSARDGEPGDKTRDKRSLDRDDLGTDGPNYGPRDRRAVYRDDLDADGSSRPPPGGSKKSGSNTGLWVLGGAAAAGAAVFGWRAYKERQQSKEFRKDLDAYFASRPGLNEGKKFDPSVLSGASNSVPGAGSVPPGAKLIIKNAIGNVHQGDTMPAISVFLVDSNGVPVKTDNVAIEVSCYVPQPCSLTGGKSVTTIAGEATFNSLVFNQAHNGVRLQFSAPGVPTVTTPNTIDVTPTNVNRN